VNDAALYGAVAEELERGLVRTDLWTKALAESDGNEPAAHERYVLLCAESLKQELADALAPQEQAPGPAEAVAVAVATLDGDAEEPVPEGDADEPAAPTATREQPAAEVVAEMQARAVSAAPQWTPHKHRGLARSTILILVLGGAALLAALGLAIAGSEGQGIALGIVGLVLLASGFYRVGKSDHYRGPLL